MTADPLHEMTRAATALAAEKLRDATPSAPSEPLIEYSLLHEAAGVVSRFGIADLHLLGATRDAVEQVVTDSFPLDHAKYGGSWALLPEVRAAVLQQLVRTERLDSALRSSQDLLPGDDPLRDGIEQLHRFGRAALNDLGIARLAAVIPFLDSLASPRFPSRDEVENRLDRLRLLESFERLAGTHFRGRTQELKKLRTYVDVLDAETVLESITRAFAAERRKPLLIYGVGGVGKSTLLAKFILDHAHAAAEYQFPWVYVDFDRRSVDVTDPASILAEAVRQIGIQFPKAAQIADALRGAWRRLRSDDAIRMRVVPDFAAFIERLGIDSRLPVLLVFDTLEEVQYRNQIMNLGVTIATLTAAIPRLRVVLAGRAQIPEIDVQDTIELREFDFESAIAFLEANGVSDPAIATAMVREVGGTPLSLRLAVQVFRLEGRSDESLLLRLVRTRKGITQDQLYARILDHIHDPDVRQLAYPGLVLRRITPEVIQEVLAGPCGIDVPDVQRARQLFDALEREIALVSPSGEPGVVMHRQDVRRVMLAPLRETKPREVLAIHQNAVNYYARFEGAVMRAEEIYHRLSLGQPFESIQPRFMPGLESYLLNAIEELPAPEARFLAVNIRTRPTRALRAGAKQETWERQAVERIDGLVQQHEFTAALEVVEERPQRSGGTALLIREAMAFIAAGELDKAENAIRDAPDTYGLAGDHAAAFDALLVHADISRRRNKFILAGKLLGRAEQMLIDGDNDPVRLVRVLAAQADMERNAEIIERIGQAAADVTDDLWPQDPLLLQRVAAIAGARDLALVTRAIRLCGDFDLIPDELQIIEDALRDAGNPNEGARLQMRILDALEDTRAREEVADAVARALLARAARRETEPFTELRIGSRRTMRVDDVVKQLKDVSFEQIENALQRRFERSLRAFSYATDAETALRDSLHVFSREGRVLQFLDALRQSALENAPLLRSLDELGVGIRLTDAGALSHEALLPFALDHRSTIAFLEHRICRIEIRHAIAATGILIAPSFVLTAADASDLQDAPLIARFDYGAVDGEPYNRGIECDIRQVFPLQKGIRAVLLHLQRPVGNESVVISRMNRSGVIRHAIRLESAVPIDERSALLWLWHDSDGLQLAGTGAFALVNDEVAIPVARTARLAGAPCFDESFHLVAMHSGQRNGGQYVALPIALLRECIGETENAMLTLDRDEVKLSGEARLEVRKAIVDLLKADQFDRVLAERLNRKRENITTANGLDQRVFDVLEAANGEWLGSLLLAVAAERPKDRAFQLLLQRHLGS